MAGIEVSAKKGNHLPPLFFRDFISEMEDGQTQNKSLDLSRQLEISTLKKSKYISPIVDIYESQENELNKKLPEIVINSVLNLSKDPDLKNEAPQSFLDKLRKIFNNYGYINDEFVSEMNKWLEQREKVIEDLNSTVNMLRLLRQTTSVIALISAAMEITRGVGALLHTFFAVNLKLRYSLLLDWVIGGISVTGSVLALSYSKQTSEHIYRDMREEKHLLRNLLVIDRRGNAVDDDVEDLFPHGIELNLVKQFVQDSEENFMEEMTLKQYLSFAILLPNFEKNKRLMHDRKFLASVKSFVESPAAKIWIYRMKLHKLLDETVTSLENHLDKKLFTRNEVLNQAAINLYPIFFPLFVDSGNLEKMRLICTSMAAISALANLSQKSEGFERIRRTSEVLFQDYRNLRRFSQEFMSEYD